MRQTQALRCFTFTPDRSAPADLGAAIALGTLHGKYTDLRAQMRFIHHQADEIRSYVAATGLNVAKCDSKGLSVYPRADSSLIEEVMENSRTLWGLALPYYLYVSP